MSSSLLPDSTEPLQPMAEENDIDGSYWTSVRVTGLHILTFIFLFICAAFILVVGYWLIRPYDVLQIKGVRVLTPTVEAGDLFEYAMDYCKDAQYGPLYARLQHSFTDGLIYNMPVEYGPLPPGCHTTIVTLVVPVLPEGNYRLQIRREYNVNRIRTVTVDYMTGVFHVNGRRRLQQMLEQQLPEVLPKVLPEVPASAIPKH